MYSAGELHKEFDVHTENKYLENRGPQVLQNCVFATRKKLQNFQST